MKFTVKVLGADRSLIERLAAAADYKLASILGTRVDVSAADVGAAPSDPFTSDGNSTAGGPIDGTDTQSSDAADGAEL